MDHFRAEEIIYTDLAVMNYKRLLNVGIGYKTVRGFTNSYIYAIIPPVVTHYPRFGAEIRRGIKMNKTELVEAIAKKADLSKKDAEAALKAFTDTVGAQLKKGDKIQLVGFGTFAVAKRAARTGKNTQTGEARNLAASKEPQLKQEQAEKELVKHNEKTP